MESSDPSPPGAPGVGAVVDVEALVASERRFRELADLLPLSLFEIDDAGRVVYMNRHGRLMWGVPEGAGEPGSSVLEITSPSNRQQVVRGIAAALRGERLRGLEFVSERPGRPRQVTEIDADPIWRDGRVVGIRGVAIDVTARREAEAALRDSERRFRELVELLPLGLVETDLHGRLTFANRHLLEMSGYSAADLDAGLDLVDIVALADQPRALGAFAGDPSLLGRLRGVEFEGRRKDGAPLQVAVYSSAIERDGRIVGVRGVAVDTSQRRQTERALRESERRFRELAALLPQLVWETDASGRFTFMNQAGLQLLGFTEADLAAGLSFLQVVDPAHLQDVAARFGALLAGQSVTDEEIGIVARDGRLQRHAVYASPAMRDGVVAGIRGVSIDVTAQRRAEQERRELEARVQHAQKLESLGVLAGGIAHDFNNLLVGILGNADLGLAETRPDGALAARLHRIKAAAERAADLTTQMLAYAGKGRALVRAVDLSAVVEEMAHLVRSGVTRHGALTFDLARDLPLIEADATQLRQVTMNLVINASEALGEAAGVITVSTGLLDVDPAALRDAWGADDLTPGRHVFLQVDDSGGGMDAATRARVFEPFFTTKFAGRGLGLAAVLGIVRAHRGAIQVRSEPGRGSTFRVLLPVPAAPLAASSSGSAPGHGAWRGRGTVLLVDDEEEVRDVGAAVLESAGFRVLCAADGGEGLRLLRERGDEIALVLLDLTMPQLGGEATLRELRRLRPALPVVVVSGHSEQDVRQRLAGLGVSATLQKPFDIEGLLRKVREALDGAEPRAPAAT